MAEPLDGIDLSSLGQNQTLQALLQTLALINKDRKKGPAIGVPEFLKEQGDRKAALADSYAPGTKYSAGFEPGGLLDSIIAMGNGPGTGYASMAADDPSRMLNPQSIDDLGNGFEDAMALGTRLRDSGDNAGPYDDVITKIVGMLLPKDATSNAPKPGEPGYIPGGIPSGSTQPGGYDPAKARNPMGGGGPRPNVPVMPADQGGAQGNAASTSAQSKIRDPYAPGERAGDSGLSTKTAQAGTEAILSSILSRLHTPKMPRVIPGYEDGGAASAPVGSGGQGTLIRVGERKPGDKKYATEEVVFAPPGTVVAPVPRGMENPSHEDALGLIISQLAKESSREAAPHTGGMAGPDMPGEYKVPGKASGFVTNSVSNDHKNQIGMAQYREGARRQGSQFDRSFGLDERKYFTSRDQNATRMGQDYDLGLRGLGQRRYEADLGSADSRYAVDRNNSTSRYGIDKNFELGNNTLNFNREAHQDEVRNWAAERALKQMLGMRGLDIDQQRANQDFQLGSAQQAFQQIMAGITGSALPGVRAGRTPMLGLIG